MPDRTNRADAPKIASAMPGGSAIEQALDRACGAAAVAAGSIFGPAGTYIGAGIGAAVGAYLRQKVGDKAHEELF